MTNTRTLRSRKQVLADRDRIEDELAPTVDRATQRFLRRVISRTSEALASRLVAAAIDPEWPTLGEISGWWAAEVDVSIIDAVHSSWLLGYGLASTGVVSGSSLSEVPTFLAKVRDRLVRGLVPPVGEDSFGQVVIAISLGSSLGWSRAQVAERIAANLGWSPHRDYWSQQQAQADRQIDAILDPLGEPGTPGREWARLNDPTVKALRTDRNSAIARLDADKSYWETRAARIARTEATAANNFAALSALHDEGWLAKEWMAAHDSRTRTEHAAADGQIVPLDSPFKVGSSSLQMPGDPSGPAHLVINCRCTILGSDDLPETPTAPLTPSTATPSATPLTSHLPAADLSDAQLEDEMSTLMGDPAGFDSPRMDTLAYEMDRRDERRGSLERLREEEQARESFGAPGKAWRRDRGNSERAIRDEYETWIEIQLLRAEQELKGVLLSARGKAEGINLRDLFMKKRRALPLWASEELQEWFSRNPRMSFQEFRSGARDDDVGRAARQRFHDRGWESEFG